MASLKLSDRTMARWAVAVAAVVVVVVVFGRREDAKTPAEEDPGLPLFLTPFLRAGHCEEARSRSRVSLGDSSEVLSHSGYITVSEEYNSNLFFWFFPAQKAPQEAPLVVWLEGGPGTSSLLSVFNQHGPFLVNGALTLAPREHTWTREHNMLYIDVPAGAGLSFTGHVQGHARDTAAVAREVHGALTQFFSVFPDYRGNDLYVSGTGEAGKYAAALAVHIHREITEASLRINLKGVMIGNGALDPCRLSDHGELFFHLSFFDVEERDHFHLQTRLLESLVEEGKWMEAYELRQALLGGGPDQSYFARISEFHNLHNLMEERPAEMDKWERFLSRPEVRRALHVGHRSLNDPAEVKSYLREDTMKSIEPWVVELLENKYRVLLYNGQLDLTFPYHATENLVNRMNWTKVDQYFESSRVPWSVGQRVAGFVKAEGGLVRVLIRNAGYFTALDQPLWTLDMMHKFTHSKPFF